jgi:hypothetical protein
MYLRKPVIATAYGDNVDFMNASNRLPLGYELVDTHCARTGLERTTVRSTNTHQHKTLTLNQNENPDPPTEHMRKSV